MSICIPYISDCTIALFDIWMKNIYVNTTDYFNTICCLFFLILRHLCFRWMLQLFPHQLILNMKLFLKKLCRPMVILKCLQIDYVFSSNITIIKFNYDYLFETSQISEIINFEPSPTQLEHDFNFQSKDIAVRLRRLISCYIK